MSTVIATFYNFGISPSYVHPLLASRDGVKQEEFDKFVKAYMGK